MKNKILLAAIIVMLTACGSRKQMTGEPVTDAHPTGTPAATSAAARTAYLRHVTGNAVTTENIVAGMSFSVKSGSKSLSAPGKLSMRRGEIIRLQVTVPILGSEVARIEFTPTHVLVVDRLHKEYVKAAYNDLDFLADNGIDFYALQDLFWNQLHLPGKKTVTEKDLAAFDADPTQAAIAYHHGKMDYQWTTTASDMPQINTAEVTYRASKGSTSTLRWQYGDFKAVGSKAYPVQQQITFATNATAKPRHIEVNLQLSSLSDNSKWDTQTTLSAKYKPMNAEALLKKILSM